MDNQNFQISVTNLVPIFHYAWNFLFEDDEVESIILEKVEQFAEKVVHKMTDTQFKSHFRLSATTFEYLLQRCGSVYTGNKMSCGNEGLPLEKKVMIFIWYLANLECFRSVADRFGVSKSTAWSCVASMCSLMLAVNNEFKIISWPNPSRAQNIIDTFRRTKFPGVIGAIDGSHITIRAPKEASNSYINRKGYHSVLLQAVCDNRMLFLDCYTGEAGSIHDACLFRRSSLCEGFHTLFKNDQHILEDSAYPLMQNLLVPYKDYGNLTQREKNYNKIHAKTRDVIEQAFAYLKGRFRRLKLLETIKPQLIAMTIMSACILHNTCILNGDEINICIEQEILEEQIMMDGQEGQILNVGQPIIKRNNIARNLENVI